MEHKAQTNKKEDRQFEQRLDNNLALLVESLRREGRKIPVIVRRKDDTYQLICGFRRTRSMVQLGEEKIKAIVLDDITDEEALKLSIIENVDREDYTDLEKGMICKNLHDQGKTQQQEADLLKIDRTMVSRYMSLTAMPEPIMGALKQARISLMFAHELKKIITIRSPEQVLKLIEKIADKNMSLRQLQNYIKALAAGTTSRPTQPETVKKTPQGFRIKAITYSRAMPLAEKKQLLETIQQVADAINADIEKEDTGENQNP